MPKRVNSINHAPQVRERIKAGFMLDRLQKHVMGEVEMTTTQIRAAEILLRKVLPDLATLSLPIDPSQSAAANGDSAKFGHGDGEPGIQLPEIVDPKSPGRRPWYS